MNDGKTASASARPHVQTRGERTELVGTLSLCYYDLLAALRPVLGDENTMAGLSEGLNKFLSNLSIHLVGAKKERADYFSRAAWERLERGMTDGLVYEHLVPKKEYIHAPCEQAARTGAFQDGTPFTQEAVAALLDRYLWIAVITKEEDAKLTAAGLSRKMPAGWDGKDILARYKAVGIELVEDKSK